MFGSRRAKATRIKGSPGAFDGLQISCDNSHPHLSWKPVRVSGRWVYPTKEEAEYTPELCRFLCVQASAAVSSPLASRPSSSRAKMLRAAVRASAGHQTRSMPPLIQEFKCTMRVEDVPPGCDVKVFPSADSSVTGEKADTSAMPAPASSTVPPSNSGSAAKPRASVHPRQVVGVYYTMESGDSPCATMPQGFFLKAA